MSVEAISWALNLAPVPADRGGQRSSPCKFVLVGLANHAGPDGTGAFPSAATLVRYTGLSERTVRGCLARLAAEGIIRPCDPAIVAARIRRADRRPKGWDLDLTLIREDLTEADAAALERQFPRRAGRLAAGRSVPDHPGSRELVDNQGSGVQPLHPAQGTGRSYGVAPKPSFEPPIEPPGATAHAREAPALGKPDGGLAGEFFAALGPAWRLTVSQRDRLAPAASAALASGWTPPSCHPLGAGSAKQAAV